MPLSTGASATWPNVVAANSPKIVAAPFVSGGVMFPPFYVKKSSSYSLNHVEKCPELAGLLRLRTKKCRSDGNIRI